MRSDVWCGVQVARSRKLTFALRRLGELVELAPGHQSAFFDVRLALPSLTPFVALSWRA